MRVRFLLDENLSPRLKTILRRLESEIDAIRIGDYGAPALGVSDSEILLYLSESQRILITDNRSTIPGHLEDFYLRGDLSHGGILWVRPDAALYDLTVDLHLIWLSSTAEEWVDRSDWIPF
jgi:hypothetical protein